MSKLYIIEELVNRSGNYRRLQATLESFKRFYKLEGERTVMYKGCCLHIAEPKTIKGLIRALNILAKYDTQHNGMSYSLVNA